MEALALEFKVNYPNLYMNLTIIMVDLKNLIII
jgi:hypothetical protein